MEKVVSKRKKKSVGQPQAQMKAVNKGEKKISIGIPKEHVNQEKRVPLTPLAVSLLANEGHKILIEAGAGNGANFTDDAYKHAGAIISKDPKEIFNCSVILKIAPMTEEEIDMLGTDRTVISALHSSTQTRENIQKLSRKGTNAIAYENIKDQNGFYPIVNLMNEIAGNSSIMIASELLSNANGGKGILLGSLAGISPTEIVIFGTGTATNSAIRIANQLGATVKIFDNNISKLFEIQEVFGKNVFTSTVTKKVLQKAIESADVVINTKKKQFGTDYFLTSEMVETMKENSVIIDLQVESGSVIETSRPTTFENPHYTDLGVIHYCVPNIASRVAKTASIAISNILSPIVSKIIDYRGIFPVIKEDFGVRNGTYLLRGILTNENLGRELDLDAKDINLLIAAF